VTTKKADKTSQKQPSKDVQVIHFEMFEKKKRDLAKKEAKTQK
jgi:hypothetical protein